MAEAAVAYGIHPSEELVGLFRERPYQGESPDKARVIFIGKDANYAPELGNHPFFNTIKHYHSDPFEFWQRHGVHHPFLLDDCPAEGKCGGVMFHRAFAKLGFESVDAHRVCFSKLLNLPMVGMVTGNESVFWNLLDLDYLHELERSLTNGQQKIAFVVEDALPLLEGIATRTGYFRWLFQHPEEVRDDMGIPRLYAGDSLRVYKIHRFSSEGIEEQLPRIRDIVLGYRVGGVTRVLADWWQNHPQPVSV
jgi:hypothetical protein